MAVFDLYKKGKTTELWKKWFGMDMIKPVGAQPFFENIGRAGAMLRSAA